MMISARHKLNISLATKDFKVFYGGDSLLVKQKTNNRSYSRIGVVVSRKNSSLAVGRNEIKRLVYRFFEENKSFLEKFSPPSDFIVIILTTAPHINDNKESLIKELKNVISI
jgi:ribonuclease P protein component